MINDIWQTLCLDRVNSNAYAKFYQNIPKDSRDTAKFGPRQSLDQWQMAFDNTLGYILSISMRMQNFIKIFHSVQEIGPVSLIQNLDLVIASTDLKCHFATSLARSCQYECVCKSSSTYFKHFKSYGHFSQIDFGLTHNFTNRTGRTHSESQASDSLSVGIRLF